MGAGCSSFRGEAVSAPEQSPDAKPVDNIPVTKPPVQQPVSILVVTPKGKNEQSQPATPQAEALKQASSTPVTPQAQAAAQQISLPGTPQAQVVKQESSVREPGTPAFEPREPSAIQARESSLVEPAGSAVPASDPPSSGKKLTILHFNDVYNIEPAERDPVGGASRFAHKAKSYASLNPLIIFSGDAFNPSLMSTVTKGEQMVPVLNAIGVHVAAVGNHDFDWGTDNLIKLMGQCKFPWLMANVLDRNTGLPFAGAKDYLLLDWHGVKVGLVGLVEEEWLETLGAVNVEDMKYVDFVELGRKLALELKAQGAEVLVAVTHMRVPNDKRLANEVPEFDIIAGGHDHHYEVAMQEKNGNLLMKSGTDFRDMTKLEVTLPPPGVNKRPELKFERIQIMKAMEEDQEVAEIVQRYEALMGAAMDTVIGETLTDLNGLFTVVRREESNLGNFVVDVWRKASNVDVVILNSGSLRSDMIHPAGELKVRDLVAILPMIDTTVVLEVPGSVIVQALENGVSQFPKLEGRFPQVSGVKFKFDPTQPPGYRVVTGSVVVGDKPLDNNKLYTLATKTYLANGKDGYDCFLGCKMLVDDEGGIVIPTCMRNHFTQLDVISRWDPEIKVNNLIRKFTTQITRHLDEDEIPDSPMVNKKVPFGIAVEHPDKARYVLNPGVEGRIINISNIKA